MTYGQEGIWFFVDSFNKIKKRRPNNWQLRNACICVRALAKLMSAAQLFSFAAA